MYYCGALQSIEILLTAAKTTNDMPWTAIAIDEADAITQSFGNTNGVTAQTVVAASKGLLRHLSIYNADTAAKTIQVRYNNNGTTYLIVSISVGPGSTLIWDSASGWNVVPIVVPFGRNFTASDTAPASPSTGDVWWETDTKIFWYWDGARWLSCDLFEFEGTAVNIASAAATNYFASCKDSGILYRLYIVDFSATMYHSSADITTKYWGLQFRKITAANVPTEVLVGSELKTNGGTASNWNLLTVVINTIVDPATHKAFDMTPIVYGVTPGNLYFGAVATYRLIHP